MFAFYTYVIAYVVRCMIVLKTEEKDDGLFVLCCMVMAKLASSVHRERIESFLVYFHFLAFLLLFFVIIASAARAFLCSLSLSATYVYPFDAFSNHLLSFGHLLNCPLSCVLFCYCQYMARRSVHTY